ncbi:LiaF transmembrane domain-containing protein [Defluviitalea phaphyphila]|uniref:LiaF transmembrane domain-containing protein n=1 Tax=Defluviitalea phaphyphila TaxID=1473580 RepID=UPI000730FE4F|nr:DUF5668 domain-containing protein [Defluviitalea phaphyphila]
MHGKKFFGVILIILGIAFLLDELKIIEFGNLIGTYWPIILIIIGLVNILKKDSILSGIILVFIGILFQMKILNIFYDIWDIFWPILLIIIGINIIFSNKFKLQKSIYNENSNSTKSRFEDIIDYFTIFSGLDTKSNSQNFKGGSAIALFGGMNIDLREAKIIEERVFLDLKAIFGGIEIKVPEDWKVVAKGIPLFGAWENRTIIRYTNQQNIPVLEVKCLALFGGIEIKN